MSPSSEDSRFPTVVTIGAGIFERDTDVTARGLGWGLILHWSLPALRTLLPKQLVEELPEAYVDRGAVERGEESTFPFFDLSTGELKTATPRVPESHCIRVTRQELRRVIATDIDIEWGKTFREYKSQDDSVTVSFEDGSSCMGKLLVACDGASSRVRRQFFPDEHLSSSYQLPIGIMGLTVDYTPDKCEALRKLDPFFFHATSSANNTFAYFSVLDAPGNRDDGRDNYSYQMVVSWPLREGFFNNASLTQAPPINQARIALMKSFAKTWEESLHSFALSLPEETEVQALKLVDWLPSKELWSTGRVVLMGDSLHAMTMYRGEGAKHAIVDVLDFVEQVGPQLQHLASGEEAQASLRSALDVYENTVKDRARPAVLTSRRACLDAHDFTRITQDSPLLTRRAMKLDYHEKDETQE